MNTLTYNLQREKRYLFGLVTLAFVLVGCYMYFVSATILHVVVRKETDQTITQLHSQLSVLETEYITAQHQVSEYVATLSGFVETSEKIFIDRTPTTLVVRDTLLP